MIWLAVLPAIIGCYWTDKTPKTKGNVAAAYFYGLFTVLALFEVLALPMIFFKCSLTALTGSWAGIVVLLALAVILKKKSFREERRWLAGLGKKMTPILAVAAVCILLQAVYVTERQHIDDDDAFYLATSTTAVETDSLFFYSPETGAAYKAPPARYVLAAWPLMIASLSRLTGMHPAILAHTAFPGLAVLWAYLCYALLGAKIYPGNKQKQSLFLLFAVVLLSFSAYSKYSSGVFLFIRGWQGKALLAGVAVPALFYGAWNVFREQGGRASWFLLSCIICSGCLFTSMGAALSLVIIGCCGLTAAWVKKRWRYLAFSAAAAWPALVCSVIYLLLR